MHDHSHQHHAGHSHTGHNESSNIAWAFFLNLGFTIIELIGGVLTNSTAIMADAIHDLGDSLSIGLAWFLNRLGSKPSDGQYTYGYRRFTLLGAVVNGIVLLIGSTWVLTEAIPRLFNPEMPVVEGMFALAILGVTVNGFAAYKMSKGNSMAERMLNWHLMEDVLGWVAVLVVSVILYFFPLPILDPLLSIAFTLFILFNVVKTLYQAARLFLQATPNPAEFETITVEIKALPHVNDVHHLHVWSLDGSRNVLTAHLVMEEFVGLSEQKKLKENVSQLLAAYHFEHTTIELEFADEECRDATSERP
jgi:cobalt-zinc-cadmium efflux system protein